MSRKVFRRSKIEFDRGFITGSFPIRKIESARSQSDTLDGFAPSGAFTPTGNPTVTPTPGAKFNGDYTALEGLGFSWSQFWLNKSPPHGELAAGLLKNQIKASFEK